MTTTPQKVTFTIDSSFTCRGYTWEIEGKGEVANHMVCRARNLEDAIAILLERQRFEKGMEEVRE